MRKRVKLFFRTVCISSVIVFCVLLGFLGTAKAYENIRLIGFGEYRSAIEIEDGRLSFFDFSIYL